MKSQQSTSNDPERRNGEQKTVNKPLSAQKTSIGPGGNAGKLQAKGGGVTRPVSKEQLDAFRQRKLDASARENQSGNRPSGGPSQSGKARPGQAVSTDRKLPPNEGRPKQFPPPDVRGPRQFPPSDVRGPKQFPPPDVRRPKQFPPPDVRKKPKPAPVKRRIEDSDDEDEYDSELDDFIDDGPEDEEDYSKHIKEIFGYDKSRYLDMDDDDECMEANFAQVLKEEFVSTKIGILEDLEDIKKEQEEKKRKAMLKKRKMR